MNNSILSVIYVMLAGIGFPIMRYMSLNFHTLNNNAVRFISASIFLFLISLYKYPYELKKIYKSFSLLSKLFILGIFMTSNMFFFMNGIKNTSALTGSLFSILSMPLGMFTASLFFKDEREHLKNWKFLLATLTSILGSLLFLFSNNLATKNIFLEGAFFLFVAILIQSFQNILVKNISNYLHPIIISTSTSFIAGFLFLCLSIQSGVINELKYSSNILLFVLSLAGVYGIFTGMLMAFYIVKKQGIVMFNFLQLLVPISTSFSAYLFLGEKISFVQILATGIIVVSCLFLRKK